MEVAKMKVVPSLEQALEIAETMVRSGAVDIIVVDSVAALVPKAEIDGDGTGVMVLGLTGEDEKREKATKRLEEEGFIVKELLKRIDRNEDLCFDCGACVSICPTGVFSHDPVTWKVVLDTNKCIACKSCVNAWARHALSVHL